MKYLNKLCLVFFLAFGLSSCDSLTELDLLDNPNAVTPENAGVDFLYNNIQLTFRNFHVNFHNISDGLIRYNTTGAFTYNNALSSTTGNGAWNNAYSRLFPDMDALEAIAIDRGLSGYEGISLVMRSYVLTTLVDYFGNVPLSEAGQGTDIISPTADPGADVYAAADALLDRGIALLSEGGATPTDDIYYGGSTAKWITLANTLKLRNALNMSVANPGMISTVASLASGDIIDESSEDFVFQYGQEREDPGSRHPFYNNHYENSDGTYMANYAMWTLCCEKLDADGNAVVDPRIRYYFYRQISDSFGQDLNAYSCVLADFPDELTTADPALAHYAAVDPRLPFCVAAANGYYGRDHLNGSGIPPDGHLRTTYGLYPGGGKWDGDTFDNVQNSGTDGGLGRGIQPIITAFSVDLMRAEAAERGSGEDARALLESGVRKSIAKVHSFAGLAAGDFAETVTNPVTGEETPRGDVFGADSDDIEAYVANVLEAYDNSSDKLDVIMKEAFIARWGNAVETFNAYRRTGKPNNMPPGLDNLAADAFPRSILLPSEHVNQNSNAEQKTLSELIFWDNGAATLR